MWRNRKKNEEPFQQGGIEVYASHEMQCVTLRVLTAGNHEACVFTLPPELARELAQRLTVSSWIIEEGPDE